MKHPRPSGRNRIATVSDEVGIELGVYGEWRLRAEFTPVFSSVGTRLRPVAVKGRVSPLLYGQPADPAAFRQAVDPRDRRMIAALTVSVCLRNLRNTFMDGLRLIVAADPVLAENRVSPQAAARALGREIDLAGLSPADVFADLTPFGRTGIATLRAAAGALRSRAIGFALTETGDGTALQDTLTPPDLVIVGGEWFESICSLPETTTLFQALIRGYRARGSIVLIEGVRSAAGLRTALDAGAQWLSGELLAEEAPAGADFPEATLPVETLLDERRVIKLSR